MSFKTARSGGVQYLTTAALLQFLPSHSLPPCRSSHNTPKMDFDEDRIYYSHQNLAAGPNANNNGADGQQQRPPGHAEAMLDLEDGAVDLGAVRRHFREFLREFGFRKV